MERLPSQLLVGVAMCLWFELLEDPRVDITLADDFGRTPLWYATCSGHFQVIEWLVASGRDLGDINEQKGKHWDDDEYTALEIARENKTEAASLLERFMANPAQTRHEVRVKLGFPVEVAAEVFALTIFLCDDLLQFKPGLVSSPAVDAVRFFAIASKLPMELQMVLCCRVVGSMKQNILL